MRCEEHVVSLNRGTDEETREGDSREAEATCKVLIGKGLV